MKLGFYPHHFTMSFPRIPSPIEAFYWSICKVLEMFEQKWTPKWEKYKAEQDSKIQKELHSTRECGLAKLALGCQ